MKISKIQVKNKNTNYPIFIGNEAISLLGKQIKKLCPKTKKVGLILDKKIPSKYKSKIKKQIKNYEIYVYEYLPSEKLKSFTKANNLIEDLLKKNFNRSDVIIAAGGGIIGDVAGFVSSILKRGVNFINLPSTLLAQVDSSIGGKTGVNSEKGKNLDLNYLQNIEKKYKINLWELAINERIFYRFNNFYKFTDDEILSILTQECKLFESILDEVEPDFFITKQPGQHKDNLFYKICRARGIKIIMLSQPKFAYHSTLTKESQKFDTIETLDDLKDQGKPFEELQENVLSLKNIINIINPNFRTKCCIYICTWIKN